MSSNLTEEQLRRMEENRLRALQLKQANTNRANINPATTTTTATVANSTFSKSNPTIQPNKTANFFAKPSNNQNKPTTNTDVPARVTAQAPIRVEASAPAPVPVPASKPTSASAAPPPISSFARLPSTLRKPMDNSFECIFADEMADASKLNNTTNTTITGGKATADAPNTGKCVYLENNPDKTRFEIIIGYNKTLIEIFKSMNTRKYDANTKRWNFSVKEYDQLMFKIKVQLANTIKIEPLEKVVAPRVTVAKCLLSDRNRFEVQVDYKPELKQIFDTLKTRRYDPNTKKYSFELKEYDELMKKIAARFPNGEVSFVTLPKAVREIFKEQFAGNCPPRFDPQFDFDHIKTRIDPFIAKSLLPFQIESICFAVQQNGRLLLADDMGLGKTIQGLAIASYYKDEWPLFIIVPSSVKFMWKESCKKWLSSTLMQMSKTSDPEAVDNFIQVIENGRQPIDSTSLIVISSYDLVARNIETISKVKYKVIISDECHLLKNSKAARTKSALKLIAHCQRVILLSGTPALSRPAELFSQIQAVNANLFTNFHEFGVRYCNAKEAKFGWDYTGYSNMHELKLLLEEKLLIRREKKDVIQQLPTKMREKIQLDPSLIETKSSSLTQASKRVEQNLKGGDKRSALLQYFQETSKAKAKAVCQYVADMIESGKKFLIFAHHQTMLDTIEQLCQKESYEYVRIDGSTASERRQFYAEHFQTSDDCKVAILSITAASSGLTLTKANIVVFAELFWNPGILVQAEDRVYRIGQRDSVIIQYLFAKGTADEEIWPLVNEKLNVLSKAGLTKEILSEAKNVDKKKKTYTSIFKEFIEVESSQQVAANKTTSLIADSGEESTQSSNDLIDIFNYTNEPKTSAPPDEDEEDRLLNDELSSLEIPPMKKSKISDPNSSAD